MADPYVHELTQGETFFLEIVVKDSDRLAIDVSTATKTIVLATGILAADFTVTDGDDTGSIEIRAEGSATALWPTGFRRANAWLSWPSNPDIEDEIILELKIKVKAAL